jgi:hypothetical protein
MAAQALAWSLPIWRTDDDRNDDGIDYELLIILEDGLI